MKIAWLSTLSSALLLSLSVTPALAVKVNSLYQAAIPVNSQSTMVRQQAIKDAFAQILIKVSGNNLIMNNPALKSPLCSAEKPVQEFTYLPAPHSASPSYLFKIQFDADSVNQCLRAAGSPVWGQNRPLILAWVEFETPEHTTDTLSSDSTHALSSLLKQAADQRGLPLIFPLMDVADLNQVSAQDGTGLPVIHLPDISRRYASHVALIGHITQENNRLISHWRLVLANDLNNPIDWDLSGSTFNDIITPLMDNTANSLAARYAAVATEKPQQDILLKVVGITQYKDLSQLTRYLENLPPVTNVDVMKTESGNQVTFKISLRSSGASFTQALTLARKLTLIIPDTPSNTAIYQWNP
jgi:hypothetical protein